jgi:subfamily B ATP-binding cassette protein MsbA
VGFTYLGDGEARPAVLNGVNLSVRAGEVLAVVGENGCGKSTLVNLLPRFFDVDRGQVLINGVDVRDFALRDLRQRVGIVTQETLLFDDSIAENIRLGRPEASSQDVERAADQAYVTQFVEQLPEGAETVVGAKGSNLSGGQRQRVALARAVLRNPEILILDEATSAIDAQSERWIHQSLQQFVKGRTVFLITHSITDSLLAFVTRIVVMDRGLVVATGTHADLLKTCSVYSRLYQARTLSPAGEDGGHGNGGMSPEAKAWEPRAEAA